MDKGYCKVTRDACALFIEGNITLQSMPQVLAQIKALFGETTPEALDLSRVNACDSSAVALVLELQRHGLQRVLHAPATFVAIADACQLGALFLHLAQNQDAT